MKRFSPREFLFLCAPIFLVGAGWIGVRLLHPPRDPDAVIALSVTRDPNPRRAYVTEQPTFDFEWKAKAQGGPQDDIQLLYSQKLVALGNGRSQVVFQEPTSPATPNVNGINFSGGNVSGPALQEKDQNMSIPYGALPLWTKRVEWRGDFVAMPLQSGAKNASGVGLPATFATLARIQGAARASETFPVAFDIKKLSPLQKLQLETVSPTNADKGADTCVTTQFREGKRRACARLVAFDGTQKRQLWNDFSPISERYWVAGQGTGFDSIWRDSQLFKLRDVPTQWGEIVYLVDAAFDPNPGNTIGDSQAVNAAEIARLKKAGWLVFSKRLTVRKAGAKITAPDYIKTPNTQYLGTQAKIYKTGWEITVQLRYNGPKLKPGEELDSRGGPEFTDAKGYITFPGLSYRIKPGTKPKEYVATIVIPTKSLGQPRPVTMKMEIADVHAAPLHFQTQLQVPPARK